MVIGANQILAELEVVVFLHLLTIDRLLTWRWKFVGLTVKLCISFQSFFLFSIYWFAFLFLDCSSVTVDDTARVESLRIKHMV